MFLHGGVCVCVCAACVWERGHGCKGVWCACRGALNVCCMRGAACKCVLRACRGGVMCAGVCGIGVGAVHVFCMRDACLYSMCVLRAFRGMVVCEGVWRVYGRSMCFLDARCMCVYVRAACVSRRDHVCRGVWRACRALCIFSACVLHVCMCALRACTGGVMCLGRVA